MSGGKLVGSKPSYGCVSEAGGWTGASVKNIEYIRFQCSTSSPVSNISKLYIRSLSYIIHIHAHFDNLPAVMEVSGISWNALTSRDLSPSSVKYRAVVRQKPCIDRAMYFSLMNRAFTTHLAASSRSVKGT